ncbi:MAG: DNA polymerase III subunit beta [Legionellales bacterium]|nr:DNA polymerase III subunit beta [Legionellales bacterium]
MHFVSQRDQLLKALQMVMGAVERKHTMAILANVHLEVFSHQLLLTATDLDIELTASVILAEPADTGTTTVSARKLLDIVRNLPAGAMVDFLVQDKKIVIRCGKSRFSLASLSAEEYPRIENKPNEHEFVMQPAPLLQVVQAVQFSIAQDDVRQTLNGLLLDFNVGHLKAVATDGHRLAVSECGQQNVEWTGQIILPRKASQELVRLLSDVENPITISLRSNLIKVATEQVTLVAKLIEGHYPNYHKVIPEDCQNEVVIGRDFLKEVLSRVAVLLTEKYKGVRLRFREHALTIIATNPQQDMAEETIELNYPGEDIDMGFNVHYLLDALAAISVNDVRLGFNQGDNSGLVIQACEDEASLYVVMPMRL